MSSGTYGVLRVEVHPTAGALAVAAAAAAADWMRESLARQPGVRVVFACAASQVQFLAALVGQPDLEWGRVVCFHMDEYLGIDAGHPASFRRFLREHLLDRVHPAAFQALCGEADQPLLECRRYEELLSEAPVDLCVLGIGENGHLAFNDPAVAEFGDRHLVKLVKLDRACREQQVGEGAFPSLEAVPQFAYTLTLPALCRARRMVGVVPERRKAKAVGRALLGPIDPTCPASILRRQEHAILYLDADSAGEL